MNLESHFDPGYWNSTDLKNFGFKKVGENVLIAKNITIIGISNISLGNNIRMANAGLELGFSALKGQKTNAFAKAIAGNEDAVVIDVWMLRALGIEKKTPTQSQYKEMADAVTAVAVKHGMTPRAMQALIWIVVRGGGE